MKQVLFICTGNIYRSKYAEAYFNYVAEQTPMFFTSIAGVGAADLEKSLPIPLANYFKAASRGTMCDQNGAKCGTPAVSTEFWDKNIKPSHYEAGSTKLTENDLNSSEIIIGMYEPEHKPQIGMKKTEISPDIPKGNWNPEWAEKIQYWMTPDQHRWGEVLDFHLPADEGLRMIEKNVRDLIKRQ
jgi:protein-tyrosine-phosphatase